MQVYSEMHLTSLLKAYRFDPYKVVVDVAGGLGHVLSGVLAAYPGIKGILFDVPETIKKSAGPPQRGSSRREMQTGRWRHVQAHPRRRRSLHAE